MKQRFKFVAVAAVLFGLTACENGIPISNETARKNAKQVITPIVSANIPGANTEAITNCIIDSATTDEIFALAASTITGSTAKTTELVLQIAQRPEAVTCIASATLTGLVTG